MLLTVITSVQLEIVEKILLEEAPSALFPFKKDILTYIVMDCLSWADGQIVHSNQNQSKKL